MDTARYVSGPYHFKQLEGRSHWLLEEVPDQVSELVLEHLRTNVVVLRSTGFPPSGLVYPSCDSFPEQARQLYRRRQFDSGIEAAKCRSERPMAGGRGKISGRRNGVGVIFRALPRITT